METKSRFSRIYSCARVEVIKVSNAAGSRVARDSSKHLTSYVELNQGVGGFMRKPPFIIRDTIRKWVRWYTMSASIKCERAMVNLASLGLLVGQVLCHLSLSEEFEEVAPLVGG